MDFSILFPILWCCGKGQLISKGLFGVFNSSKRKNEKKKSIKQYYDTSGRIVFVRFLEELSRPGIEDTKKSFWS